PDPTRQQHASCLPVQPRPSRSARRTVLGFRRRPAGPEREAHRRQRVVHDRPKSERQHVDVVYGGLPGAADRRSIGPRVRAPRHRERLHRRRHRGQPAPRAVVRPVPIPGERDVPRRDPPVGRLRLPTVPHDRATAHGERDGRGTQPERRGLPELDSAGADDRMVAPVLIPRPDSIPAHPGNPGPATRLHRPGERDVHVGDRPLVSLASGDHAVTLNFLPVVVFQPFYRIDSLSYTHYSAVLLLQGRNPYAESMIPSLTAFGVPPDAWSPLEAGGLFGTSPYPPLAFLVYVPILALGATDVRVVYLAFHLAGLGILYARAPPPFRGIAPIGLVMTLELVQYTPWGVPDILWVVPALLMATDLGRPARAGLWYG